MLGVVICIGTITVRLTIFVFNSQETALLGQSKCGDPEGGGGPGPLE